MNDIDKRISQTLVKGISYRELKIQINHYVKQGKWYSVQGLMQNLKNDIWMKLYTFPCNHPSEFSKISDWKDWAVRRVFTDLMPFVQNHDADGLHNELGFIFEEMMTGLIK